MELWTHLPTILWLLYWLSIMGLMAWIAFSMATRVSSCLAIALCALIMLREIVVVPTETLAMARLLVLAMSACQVHILQPLVSILRCRCCSPPNAIQRVFCVHDRFGLFEHEHSKETCADCAMYRIEYTWNKRTYSAFLPPNTNFQSPLSPRLKSSRRMNPPFCISEFLVNGFNGLDKLKELLGPHIDAHQDVFGLNANFIENVFPLKYLTDDKSYEKLHIECVYLCGARLNIFVYGDQMGPSLWELLQMATSTPTESLLSD